MRIALRAIASIVLGALLLILLGTVYGIANLPVYHSWGLTHGSFTTAIPALVATSFVSLGLIPWFGPTVDPTQRIIASLSVLPLVTALFWVDQHTSYAVFSFWHAALYGVVFCLLVILCLRSKKPILVPLFMLVPILIDPLFNLLIVGMSGLSGMELFTHDLLSKVLPVVLASGAALALARYLHAYRA